MKACYYGNGRLLLVRGEISAKICCPDIHSERLVMPVIKQHGQDPEDKMFFEHANLQHPRRHHEMFLRKLPYRGELPTVAGFLLYPDAPAKMETTSHEAFCFRPILEKDRNKGDHITQQVSPCPHPTSSRQTERKKSSNGSQEEPEGNHNQQQGSATVKNEDTLEMQSQYQKDFPPPSSCRRRRTPAFPQPDNIGINPGFRIEFSTVQRETFPGWTITNPGCAGSELIRTKQNL